jgi:hypothetical protein
LGLGICNRSGCRVGYKTMNGGRGVQAVVKQKFVGVTAPGDWSLGEKQWRREKASILGIGETECDGVSHYIINQGKDVESNQIGLEFRLCSQGIEGIF